MTYQEFVAWVKTTLTSKPKPIMEPSPIVLTMPTIIYNTAKKYLGVHVTLNPNVAPEVGCAEAVSFILKNAGIAIPEGGIAGTASLADWLSKSPQFEEIHEPEQGCVIVSATGAGNGQVRGHTGIMAAFNLQYASDWGILSNDSQTGLFLELWSLASWDQFYGKTGGLPVRFFRGK